ncbi:MAG: hypothetical protein KA152_13595 [Verrucomicrobiales bacterium]|nr:hypothetical protein [Verrucomicrobiales bacterium]
MNEISIYPIVPASGKSLWFLVPVLLMLAAVAGLLIYLMFSTKKTRFEVSPQGLRIRGDIYGRLISKEHLLPEEAVALDLVKDVDWRPKWRTNGAALPGYQSGWFRLRNKKKALLFVTDQHHVVKLPTRDGYTILLSVVDPGQFIAEAKAIWSSKKST